MSGEIVPFGKYRGQPVEALAADTDYCEWLTAQPWFRSKYGNVYNILIQGGAEPRDTPEHNEMQARFLEDDWCRGLAVALFTKGLGHESDAVSSRCFEIGWDVEFTVMIRGEISNDVWEEGRFVRRWEPCDLSARVDVELKPDLGDDYPEVLRQVKRHEHLSSANRCVVVRRHSFEHVTWDQVRKIFKASGIVLLAESEIIAQPSRMSGLALVKDRLGGRVVEEIETTTARGTANDGG